MHTHTSALKVAKVSARAFTGVGQGVSARSLPESVYEAITLTMRPCSILSTVTHRVWCTHFRCMRAGARPNGPCGKRIPESLRFLADKKSRQKARLRCIEERSRSKRVRRESLRAPGLRPLQLAPTCTCAPACSIRVPSNLYVSFPHR